MGGDAHADDFEVYFEICERISFTQRSRHDIKVYLSF